MLKNRNYFMEIAGRLLIAFAALPLGQFASGGDMFADLRITAVSGEVNKAQTISVSKTSEDLTSIVGNGFIDLIRLEPLDENANYPPVVTAMAATEDGKYLVAAGDDHAIRVVDLETGRILRTLQGHVDWVQAVALDEEKRVVLSCGNDGRLIRWSADNQWKPIVIQESESALMAMAVDRNRTKIAVGGFCNAITIYSLENYEKIDQRICECADQRCMVFSEEGNRLASGGRDGVLRIWDLTTQDQPQSQKLHQDRIRSIRFEMDSSFVTTVGEDRLVVRYNWMEGKVEWSNKIKGGKLLSLTAIDSETIAVAGSDNTIRLINARTGEEKNRLIGHDGSVAIMLRNGQHLLSGSFDTTVRIWDLQMASSGKQARNYEHPVTSRFIDSGASESVR